MLLPIIKTVRIAAVAALGLLISAAAATATTLSFDFRDPGDLYNNAQHSIVYMDTTNSLSVEVSAFENGNTRFLNTRADGLGVQGNPEGGFIGLSQLLRFDFAPLNIQLFETVVFEVGPQSETVNLLDQNGAFITSLFVPASSSGGSEVAFDLSGLNVRLPSFSIEGTAPDGPGQRGLRVVSIDVQVVPLPAPVLLYGFSIMALGVFGFRRKSAA